MNPEQARSWQACLADDCPSAEEAALAQQCEADSALAAECLADARTDSLLRQLAIDGAAIKRSLQHRLAAENDGAAVVDTVRARLQAETLAEVDNNRPWAVVLVATAVMVAMVWAGLQLGTAPTAVPLQALAQAPLREDGRLLRPYSVADQAPLAGLQHTIAVGDDWRPVVLLDWNDTAGATAYRVYRQAPGRSQLWQQVADQLPSSDFHDRDTEAGQVYHYYVTAVDAAGRESERSVSSSCETPARPRDGEHWIDIFFGADTTLSTASADWFLSAGPDIQAVHRVGADRLRLRLAEALVPGQSYDLHGRDTDQRSLHIIFTPPGVTRSSRSLPRSHAQQGVDNNAFDVSIAVVEE